MLETMDTDSGNSQQAVQRRILEYFRKNGADQVALSTKESNNTALGLYHKFVFRENGEMKDDRNICNYSSER